MNDQRRYPDARGREPVWAVRAGTAALGLGALGLLAPLIWSALSGALGLLALAALGVLGVGIFQTLPYLGQKLENRLLAARKAEARANPIEQLQNFLLQKSQGVTDFRRSVLKIGAQIKSMGTMLEERKRHRPDYDATRQESALRAMQDAQFLLIDKYRKAEHALKELSDIVEDKQFEWKFGQAGQEAMQNLNATNGQELLNDMLADEAFDAVRDNFNHVFAELELEAKKLRNAKPLSLDT